MWLGHVGLAQPVEAIGGDPAIVAATRSALESGASALQDELRLSLDFYAAQEGAVPVERVRPHRARQRDPRASPIGSNPPSACPSRSAGRRPSPSSTQASAARLTLSYGLALED